MDTKVAPRSGTAEGRVEAPPKEKVTWKTLFNLPVAAPAPVERIVLAQQPALAQRPEGGTAPTSN